MKARSFAWPLVLIALGAVFLINNVVPDLSIWQLLGDWWPLLLIGFGLIRVVEVLFAYYETAGIPQNAQPGGGGRSIGFGWILIIILLGVASTLPRHFHGQWRQLPIKAAGVEIFGEEYNYPATRVAPAGSLKRLVLDNVRGNISVTGSDVSEVRAEGQKIIHAYDRNAADTIDRETKIDLVSEGDQLFLRASEPSNTDKGHMSVELSLTVPKGMSVEARGKSGDLTITSIEGSVDVSSQRGEIHIQDIGGNTKLDVERADLVHAAGLHGALDIQGKGRDLQVENVAGLVTVNGDFSGTLDFRNITQPLHFESAHTDLRIDSLPGSVSMDLSTMRVENAQGPIHFTTNSRDVNLIDFTGPVSIEVGRGDVELKPAQSKKLGRIDVRSREGNIQVALPPNGQFALNAVSQQSDVTNDYGDGIVSSSEGKGNALHSENPSGPEILLNTTRGTISVRKLE